MTIQISAEQQRQWLEDGYVVIRNAADSSMIDRLRTAVDQIIDRALELGPESDVQWIDEGNRVPHFLSDFLSRNNYDTAFGELLSDVTLPVMENLTSQPLRTSWMMLLTGGGGHPYSVGLHRDNSTVGVESEEEMLKRYDNRQCYFQAPLLPDQFLQVVPGSHIRPSTPEEKAVVTGSEPCTAEQVEGLITIELDPGDIIFRSTNLLHQGYNPNGEPRQTLVSASWADCLEVVPVEKKDYELVNDAELLERMPTRLRDSVQRYLTACEAGRHEKVQIPGHSGP